MLTIRTFGAAALALAVVVGTSGLARAGEGCCGEQAAKREEGGKPTLVEREKALAEKTEAALARISAPAAPLSEADAKTLAEAKQALVSTCPFGGAMTAAMPLVVEALDALLVEMKDGCAGCGEACKDAKAKGAAAGAPDPEAIVRRSLGRASKLARPLAAWCATFRGEAPAKPAGAARPDLGALAKGLEAAAGALAAAGEKAGKLGDAEKAKIGEARQTIGRIAPAQSVDVMWAGTDALFCNLALAAEIEAQCQGSCAAKSVILALGKIAGTVCRGEEKKAGECGPGAPAPVAH